TRGQEPVPAVTEPVPDPTPEPLPETVPEVAPPMAPINSFVELMALLAKWPDSYRGVVSSSQMAESSIDRENALTSGSQKDAAADTSANSYSQTNVQVAGVDEGDNVKNDGNYVYRIDQGSVDIIRAWPVESMKVVSRIEFGFDNKFYPAQLYLSGDRLIVLGYAQRIPVSPQCSQVVQILVYDIRDRSNPVKVKSAEVEGVLLSSRRVGDMLYVVTNRTIYYKTMLDHGENGALPAWREDGKDFKTPAYSQLGYIPDSYPGNYMVVASLNVASAQEPVKFKAYLGAGNNLYMSLENLYIAAYVHYAEILSSGESKVQAEQGAPAVGLIAPRIYPPALTRTRIYRIPVKNGEIGEATAGEVPGTIINQFSMDEYNGYFRIGTTDSNWSSGQGGNNLYVLDNSMKIQGKLEGLAKGEKIYSVRFMGPKAYMVTFRTTDPLFAFDLSDPAGPRMTGYLKIPGYSDYLHPFDETHMIGFGKDTVEISGMAYYLGMKLSLFDITNMESPQEMDKEIIGDRGTSSELLHNHKALLFSRDKNLLAFPVTLYTLTDAQRLAGGLQYGRFTRQGLWVYSIDLVKGFELRGIISHYQDAFTLPEGKEAVRQSGRDIQRSFYIGDALYTLSGEILMAHALADLKILGYTMLK
ncbi:MAG TPA: hypothetical protein DD727_05765, partial [Clostridiales bacterium]|nr:hypothetical protein [Clostridiales bacterium]